jgi:hypothetical protein
VRTSRVLLPLVLSAAFIAIACADSIAPPRAGCASPVPQQGVVTFTWDARPEDTMRVLVTDAPTVAAACAFLVSGTGPRMPTGMIARGAGSDPTLPFHYLPESVRIVDAAIEICDGRLMKTAASLDDYIEGATGDRNAAQAPYCPWGARPIAVE